MADKEKSSLINTIRRIRSWEQKQLPTYGTDAGYALFLELASLVNSKDIPLKQVYLSLPFAESTIRLLIRNLEEDGWIALPQGPEDKRQRFFNPTEKFHVLVDEWIAVNLDLISSVKKSKVNKTQK